jgi:hypothetical protein
MSDNRPTLILPPKPESPEPRKHIRLPRFSVLFGLIVIAISAMSSLTLTYYWLSVTKSLYDAKTEDVVKRTILESTTSGRVFVPRDGNHYYQEDIIFEPMGRYPWSFVTDPEGLVVAIYIQFEPGNDTHLAKIKTPYNVQKIVKFERGSGIGFFDYGPRIVVLDKF